MQRQQQQRQNELHQMQEQQQLQQYQYFLQQQQQEQNEQQQDQYLLQQRQRQQQEQQEQEQQQRQRQQGEITATDAVQQWWRDVKDHERPYHFYAAWLVLPEDTEALNYMLSNGDELNVISGDQCLVLAFGDPAIKRLSFAGKHWNKAVRNEVTHGYSRLVAKRFGVKLTSFPALLLFDDITRSRSCVVSLQGLTRQEIVSTLRSVFSATQVAIDCGKDPLNALRSETRNMALQRQGKSIVSVAKGLGEKAVDKILEVWVKAAMGSVSNGVHPEQR